MHGLFAPVHKISRAGSATSTPSPHSRPLMSTSLRASRERSGSQESVSSLSSTASSVSRSRVRLGVTSLANQVHAASFFLFFLSSLLLCVQSCDVDLKIDYLLIVPLFAFILCVCVCLNLYVVSVVHHFISFPSSHLAFHGHNFLHDFTFVSIWRCFTVLFNIPSPVLFNIPSPYEHAITHAHWYFFSTISNLFSFIVSLFFSNFFLQMHGLLPL